MSMPSSDRNLGSDRNLAVAIDIGGTFTDVTVQDFATGQAWRAKTPSNPADPSLAFIEGMNLALAQAGAEAGALARVLHGTTVATNLILEGKGAATALVTTAGFRHVLDIGRQDIPRVRDRRADRSRRGGAHSARRGERGAGGRGVPACRRLGGGHLPAAQLRQPGA
jgi:N-methylhydantoinase A/oxoprolinase/acetone carboxylase beta subunit